MNRILLARPAAHVIRQIECEPASIFVVQLPLHETTVSREGNDLVFAFDDDSAVRLHSFYTVYGAEHLPLFELDGNTVEGKAFLTALLDENIETALGTADGAGHHGLYLDAADGQLMGGLGILGSVDKQVAERDITATPEGLNGRMAADLSQATPISRPEPDSQDEPANPPDIPYAPESPEPEDPVGHGMYLQANGVMQVAETALPQGTAPDAAALSVTGSMRVVNAGLQGCVQSITVTSANGEAVSIFDATAGLSGNAGVVTANGTLVFTAFADNVLQYIYTLTEPVRHEAAGNGAIAPDAFTVTVTRSDGAQAHASLDVYIVDDAPVLHLDAASGKLVDLGADRYDALISWGNLDFVDASGHHYGQIYANGEPVTLQALALSSVVGQTSQGPAFVLTANPENGSYVFEQYATLDCTGPHSKDLAECRMEAIDSGAYHNGIRCYGDDVEVLIRAASGDKVNVSGQGIGVHNNWLNAGETLIFDMAGERAVLDFSFGYGSTGNKTGIANVTVTFRDGTDFHFVTGSNPSAGPFVLSEQEGYPAGLEIASVAVTGVESGKLLLGSVYANSPEDLQDVSLVAHFTAIDGDGDQVKGFLPLTLNECISSRADGLLSELADGSDTPQAIMHSLQTVLQDELLASMAINEPEPQAREALGNGTVSGVEAAMPLSQPAFALAADEHNVRFDALLEGGQHHTLLSAGARAPLGTGNNLMDCDTVAANLGIDPHSGANGTASMIPQVDMLLAECVGEPVPSTREEEQYLYAATAQLG